MLDQAVAVLDDYAKNFDGVAKSVADKDRIDAMQRPLGGRLQSNLSELLRSGIERKDFSLVALAAQAQERLQAARLSINMYFADALSRKSQKPR